jgi:hypothetical protein
MAVGFAEGELDAATGLYVVRERNAHAWPEVFFPTYGWIEFEPTASEPPLARPERSTLTDGPTAPQPSLSDLERGPQEDDLERDPTGAPGSRLIDWGALLAQWGRTVGVGLLAAAVVGLAALAWLLSVDLIGLESLGRPGRRLLRWLGRAVPSAVTQAYLELERAARWLGLKLPPNLTPNERAAELNATVPEARPAVDTITAQYIAEQYSPYPEMANGRLAQNAWRSIRTRVWRQGIRAFVRGLLEDDLSRAARSLRRRIKK